MRMHMHTRTTAQTVKEIQQLLRLESEYEVVPGQRTALDVVIDFLHKVNCMQTTLVRTVVGSTISVLTNYVSDLEVHCIC